MAEPAGDGHSTAAAATVKLVPIYKGKRGVGILWVRVQNVHAVDGQWLNTVQPMPRKLVGLAIKPMKRAVQGFYPRSQL